MTISITTQKKHKLTDNLIYGIVVVERDERKASFLARLLVCDDVDAVDLAVRREVVSQVVVVNVLLDAPDKHLLHCDARVRATGLGQNNKAVVTAPNGLHPWGKCDAGSNTEKDSLQELTPTLNIIPNLNLTIIPQT